MNKRTEIQRRRRHRQQGKGISVLVPAYFPDPTDQRAKNWSWLYRYWVAQLPAAQIVIGFDTNRTLGADGRYSPFNKSAAINDAASRATGDVYVIADADCLAPVASILEAAHQIREARRRGHRTYYIPYRRFYRLSHEATDWILRSCPEHVVRLGDPPPRWELQPGPVTDRTVSHGHWWGALIQEMPREAFESIGGWDERFQNWGGEDVSTMHCLDTVWAKHRTLNAPVYHLWHPHFGEGAGTRTWSADAAPGGNGWLASRYNAASGDRSRMLGVIQQRWT